MPRKGRVRPFSNTPNIYCQPRSSPSEVFDLKKILPMLLLALMAVTAGTLIVTHAASVPRIAKTSQAADNDDVQAGDQTGQTGDHDDGATGDTDDGATGNTDSGNVQAGQDTTDAQDGPDDNVTVGDQVEETTDTGVTGTSDVATMVEQAIGF